MPRTTKRVRKNRGMPPPATFDINALPGSSNLTALEASAVIRRTPGALEQWRRDQNHPLTRRETQQRLSVDYHRNTIRSLLALLARDGRVHAKGDVLQPRYRPAEDT